MKTLTKNIVLAAMKMAGMKEEVKALQNGIPFPGELARRYEEAQKKIKAATDKRRADAMKGKE